MDIKNRIEGEVYFVTDTMVEGVVGGNNCLKGISKRITNPYNTYSWDDISQQQA